MRATPRLAPLSSWLSILAALAGLACAPRPGHAQNADSEEHDKPGVSVAAESSASDFAWSEKLGEHARLEVNGVAGDITIEPSTDGTTRVTATKSGPDAADLDIVVERSPRGVKITAKHKRANRPHDARADFVVHAGPGVAVEAHTVSGDISARGVTGATVLESVNGSVDVSARGDLQAKTVNGRVTARLVAPLGNATLKTVNGSLELALPETADAHIEASVVNGRVETDFQLARSRGFVGARVSGTVGKGGPKIALESVNGTIAIRKQG